ncbi:hypothetical protein C2845_PM02G22590 [Panicum miliaceum]|uniref:Uncharacterized protein n=1 Tax=Panicum miliaceum TaxID=4540 RepID=A0A3L6S8K1_PANMI|nr:hypothetical protein C2845_PM02G22590 [Panicum miliaceum]
MVAAGSLGVWARGRGRTDGARLRTSRVGLGGGARWGYGGASQSPSGARWWWRCFSPPSSPFLLGVVAMTAPAWATSVPGRPDPEPGDRIRHPHGRRPQWRPRRRFWGKGSSALAAGSSALWAGGGSHGGGILAIGGGQRRPAALIAGSGASDGGGQWWLRRVAVLRARQRKPGLRAWPSRRVGRRSYAAATRNRRAYAPLEGLLRDIRATMTAVTTS